MIIRTTKKSVIFVLFGYVESPTSTKDKTIS